MRSASANKLQLVWLGKKNNKESSSHKTVRCLEVNIERKIESHPLFPAHINELDIVWGRSQRLIRVDYKGSISSQLLWRSRDAAYFRGHQD